MAKKRCGCKHGSGMAKDLAGVFLKEMIKSGLNRTIAGSIKPLPKKGGSMKLSLHSMIQRERNKPYKPPQTIMYNKTPTRGGFIFKDINSLIPVGQTYRNFRDPTIPVGLSRRY